MRFSKNLVIQQVDDRYVISDDTGQELILTATDTGRLYAAIEYFALYNQELTDAMIDAVTLVRAQTARQGEKT